MRDEKAIAAKRVATIKATGGHAAVMEKARATRRERELAAGVPTCSTEGCDSLLRSEVTRERGLCNRCDKEALKAYQAQYRIDNAERLAADRRVRSGVTQTVAKEMKEAAGACELCGGATDVIDHNHKTKAVRGVLCHYCNTRLGMLEAPDFESWRLRAMTYLAERG